MFDSLKSLSTYGMRYLSLVKISSDWNSGLEVIISNAQLEQFCFVTLIWLNIISVHNICRLCAGKPCKVSNLDPEYGNRSFVRG